jgi:positive regulator of sigma E activity
LGVIFQLIVSLLSFLPFIFVRHYSKSLERLMATAHINLKVFIIPYNH